jgi:hypothetical protein
MSDFLMRLAQRTLGVAPVLHPSIAPMFSPGLEMPSNYTSEETRSTGALDVQSDLSPNPSPTMRGENIVNSLHQDNPVLPIQLSSQIPNLVTNTNENFQTNLDTNTSNIGAEDVQFNFSPVQSDLSPKPSPTRRGENIVNSLHQDNPVLPIQLSSQIPNLVTNTNENFQTNLDTNTSNIGASDVQFNFSPVQLNLSPNTFPTRRGENIVNSLHQENPVLPIQLSSQIPNLVTNTNENFQTNLDTNTSNIGAEDAQFNFSPVLSNPSSNPYPTQNNTHKSFETNFYTSQLQPILERNYTSPKLNHNELASETTKQVSSNIPFIQKENQAIPIQNHEAINQNVFQANSKVPVSTKLEIINSVNSPLVSHNSTQHSNIVLEQDNFFDLSQHINLNLNPSLTAKSLNLVSPSTETENLTFDSLFKTSSANPFNFGEENNYTPPSLRKNSVRGLSSTFIFPQDVKTKTQAPTFKTEIENRVYPLTRENTNLASSLTARNSNLVTPSKDTEPVAPLSKTETFNLAAPSTPKTETFNLVAPSPSKAETLHLVTPSTPKAETFNLAASLPSKAETFNLAASLPSKAETFNLAASSPSKTENFDLVSPSLSRTETFNLAAPSPSKTENFDLAAPSPSKTENFDLVSPSLSRTETFNLAASLPSKAETLNLAAPSLSKIETLDLVSPSLLKTENFDLAAPSPSKTRTLNLVTLSAKTLTSSLKIGTDTKLKTGRKFTYKANESLNRCFVPQHDESLYFIRSQYTANSEYLKYIHNVRNLVETALTRSPHLPHENGIRYIAPPPTTEIVNLVSSLKAKSLNLASPLTKVNLNLIAPSQPEYLNIALPSLETDTKAPLSKTEAVNLTSPLKTKILNSNSLLKIETLNLIPPSKARTLNSISPSQTETHASPSQTEITNLIPPLTTETATPLVPPLVRGATCVRGFPALSKVAWVRGDQTHPSQNDTTHTTTSPPPRLPSPSKSIKVSIGRIDVQNTTAPEASRRRTSKSHPNHSLKDYLKRREGRAK